MSHIHIEIYKLYMLYADSFILLSYRDYLLQMTGIIHLDFS